MGDVVAFPQSTRAPIDALLQFVDDCISDPHQHFADDADGDGSISLGMSKHLKFSSGVVVEVRVDCEYFHQHAEQCADRETISTVATLSKMVLIDQTITYRQIIDAAAVDVLLQERLNEHSIDYFCCFGVRSIEYFIATTDLSREVVVTLTVQEK